LRTTGYARAVPKYFLNIEVEKRVRA